MMARATPSENMAVDTILLRCSLAGVANTAFDPPHYLGQIAARPAQTRPDLRAKAQALLNYQDKRVWNHADPYHAAIRSLARDVLAMGRA